MGFENISPQKDFNDHEEIKKSRKKNKGSMDRRGFIKKTFTLGAAAAVGSAAFNITEKAIGYTDKLKEKIGEKLEERKKREVTNSELKSLREILHKNYKEPEQDQETEPQDALIEDIPEEEISEGIEITEEPTPQALEEEKDEEEKEIDFAEALDFKSKQEIVLDQKFIDTYEEYYFDRFKQGGEEHNKMINGYSAMGEEGGIKLLKQPFKDRGLPEGLIGIAIIESDGGTNPKLKQDKKGSRNPVGWHQIAKLAGETEDWGELTINKTVDERFVPLKSNEACAKIVMKELMSTNNDIRLTMAWYNLGGIGTDFLDKTPKKERTYPNLLKERENKINHYKKELKDKKEYIHTVQDGEILSKIADKFHIKSYNTLARLNNLKSPDDIKPGQKIKIPLGDINHRKNIFNTLIKKNGLLENVPYVAQVMAAQKIIDSGELDYLQVSKIREMEPGEYKKRKEV